MLPALFGLVTAFSTIQTEVDESEETSLLDILLAPFQGLAEILIWELSQILLNTPTIYPNEPVEEIHHLLFILAAISTGIVVVIVGHYLIIGPITGVSEQQAWSILPRLVIALVFAGISLPLLQLGVDLNNALVHAFRPPQFETTLQEMAGLSVAISIVWLINSLLLLAVVVILVLANAYLLFVGSLAPILAVGWTLPTTQRYAQSLISGWFTALALAPTEMLILRFSFEMMKGTAGFGVQGISNWVIGIASFALLLWIPAQLYSASQAAITRGTQITNSIIKGKPPKRPGTDGPDLTKEEIRRVRRNQRRRRGGGRGGI
ncbi:hypothetical protein ACLI4R_14500 [Natrialbaceae archaeon A-chndr2]